MAEKHLKKVEAGKWCNLTPSLMIGIAVPRLQSLFDIGNNGEKDADDGDIGFGSGSWKVQSSHILWSQLHQQIYSGFTLV